MRRLIEIYIAILDTVEWLGPLVARVVAGLSFFQFGRQKLENMPIVVSSFHDLGIAFSQESAWLVAIVECFGGLFIMVGLGTRLWALPLCIVMIVATFSAHGEEVRTLTGFSELHTVTFFAIFFWLLTAGPGRASVDWLIAHRIGPGVD